MTTKNLAAPMVGGLLIAAIAGISIFAKDCRTRAAAGKRPEDTVLARYSFAMKPGDAHALFGVGVGPGAKVKLREPGTFAEIDFATNGSYGVDLVGGSELDVQRARRRLEAVAPHRAQVAPDGRVEISTGRGFLRFTEQASHGNGTFELASHLKGEPGIAAADALLAIVLYAAMSGPAPTAEQQRAVFGPPLADVAKLSPTTQRDDAEKAFVSALEGSCNVGTEYPLDREMLICSADVDHPLIAKVWSAWPNAPRGRLQFLRFGLVKSKGEAATAPGACLDAAFGVAKEVGTSDHHDREWRFGDDGDRALDDGDTIMFSTRKDAGADVAPEWATAYAKIVTTLERCAGP